MSDYKIHGYPIGEIQKKMLEILVEVDRLCQKHGINYILDGGTMLGAIRHGGFIPWDDDLDIAILREDYDRLIGVCKTELNSKYYLQTMQTDKKYPLNFAKIKLNGTIYTERDYAHLNIHNGIYIDIFPIDNINIKTYKLQCMYLRFVRGIRFEKLGLYKNRKRKWVFVPFRVLPLSLLARWSEHVMRLKNGKQTEWVYKVCHPGNIKPPYKRSLYTELVRVSFEGYRFLVPADYDAFLKARYGNYMEYPPEDQRQPCHNIMECMI